MSAERLRAVLRMAGLVGFEAVAVVSIYLVGRAPSIGVDWSDPAGWLAVTPTDQIVVSMVWLAAAGMACWMLGSTLLYLVARCWGLRRVLRVAERLAVPAVRRMVDRAVAATLVGTVLLGPAAPAVAAEADAFDAMTTASEYEPQPAGSEQPPVSAPVPQRKAPKPVEQRSPERDDDAEGESQRSRSNNPADNDEPPDNDEQTGNDDKESSVSTGSDGKPQPEGPLRPGADGAAARRDGGSDEPAGQREKARERLDGSRTGDGRPDVPRPGHRYTVRAGDHLWKIATEIVAGGDGTADRAAVASYWADLVREATPGLRSGNPDLIYPGEQITLPHLADHAREDP